MGLFDRLRRSAAGSIGEQPLDDGGPRAMTAAAARVDLTDRTEGVRLANRQPWQADAWAYRDAIGEVRYALDWLGDVKSRLRLYVGVVLDPDEAPVGVLEATTPPVDADDIPTGQPAAVTDLPPELIRDATDALLALGAGGGGAVGHGHLLDPLTVNLEVAGECYLVGQQDPVTYIEDWSIRSMDELGRRADGTWVLRDAPGIGVTAVNGGSPLPADAYVARIWNPHPRWHNLPDSAMRGILGNCEALLLAERRSRVRDRARLSRGILLVASEIEFVDATGRKTDFQERLTSAMVSAVADESSPASLTPTVARVAAERIKDGTAMKHVDVIDRDDDTRDDEKITRHLRRIGRGLDIPPEVIDGLKDVKFANAIAIDSTGFRYHIEPKAQRDVDGLTIAYLWPRLEALGHDPVDIRRLVIWYDPAEVVANPNPLPDALLLHERLVVSDAYLREAAGIPDSQGPSDDELLRRTGLNGRVDSGLTLTLLRLLGGEAPNLPAVTPTDDVRWGGAGPAPGAPAAAAAAITAAAVTAPTPAAWSDVTLRADLELRARVESACDAAMRRALERAGARLVSRIGSAHAYRPLIADVARGDVARTLGAERVAALDVNPEQLLAGAFVDLHATFRSLASATFEGGLRASCELIGQPYADPGITGLLAAADIGVPFSDLGGIDQVAARARAAADIIAAADGLVADLTDATRLLLFQPPTIPGQGEYDPTLIVDRSTVRRAVARAGGADSSVSYGGVGPTGQSAVPSDDDPGMIATGRTNLEALASAGVPVYAQQWIYGNSGRPFPPHKALSGLIFADRSESALSVLSEHTSWLPSTTYSPGDHRGCACSLAQLVADPFDGMDTTQAQSVRARQQTRDVRGRFVDPSAP